MSGPFQTAPSACESAARLAGPWRPRWMTTRVARSSACLNRRIEMSASNPLPVNTSPAVTAATTADAIAEQFRTVLVTLLAIVPDLQKYDSRQIRRITASAKFGNEAIIPVINLVASVPRMKESNLFDVDAGHFARQFKDQVVPLAMQLIEFANDVIFTSQNLLSASSVQALQIYRLGQHAVKQPDGADLQPFVDTMSHICLLYTSPSPRDGLLSRMPSSA